MLAPGARAGRFRRPGSLPDRSASNPRPSEVKLGADGERRLDPLWQPIRPGDAEQVRAVDVEDVERQRRRRASRCASATSCSGSTDGATTSRRGSGPGGPASSRPSPPGGSRSFDVPGARSSGPRPTALDQGCRGSGNAGRSSSANAGRGSDVREGGRGRLGEQPAGGLEDPLSVSFRAILARLAGSHLVTSLFRLIVRRLHNRDNCRSLLSVPLQTFPRGLER